MLKIKMLAVLAEVIMVVIQKLAVLAHKARAAEQAGYAKALAQNAATRVALLQTVDALTQKHGALITQKTQARSGQALSALAASEAVVGYAKK